MSTIELKKELHHLIESIDSDKLLNDFYKLIKNRVLSKEGNLLSRLTKKEQEELYLSFEESQIDENLISHTDMKVKLSKWL